MVEALVLSVEPPDLCGVEEVPGPGASACASPDLAGCGAPQTGLAEYQGAVAAPGGWVDLTLGPA